MSSCVQPRSGAESMLTLVLHEDLLALRLEVLWSFHEGRTSLFQGDSCNMSESEGV